MRWAVKTDVSTENIGATQKKIKKTTKTQYITVGDIVAGAKSMAGAVKNIVRKVPSYRDAFRLNGDSTSANLAQLCLNIATPLSAIITGTEVYKKAMNVINTLTPIVKLIARGTGIWCSPGNAGDIANIVLGTVQQVLIAIITQTIIALKEWVFNFEFKLKEITTEASTLITRNLKKSSSDLNRTAKETFKRGITNVSSGAGYGYGYGYDDGSEASNNSSRNEILASAFNEINSIAGNLEAPEATTDEIVEAFKSLNNDENTTQKRKYGNSWITITPLNENLMREFRGSINNYGIQYSDIEDGKVVWKNSNKTDGCFCCFGKIVKDDGKVVYVAGSNPWIKPENLSIPEEDDWQVDNYGQYNKDYYTYKTKEDSKLKNDNFIKVRKTLKDEKTLIDMAFNSMTKCYEAKNFKKAIGIWYSLDDGLTWSQSGANNIYVGNFFDFKKTEEYPSTIMAADYDYKGMLYSTDGSHWERAKLYNEDFNHGRFPVIYDIDASKVRCQPNIVFAPQIKATVSVLEHIGKQEINSSENITVDVMINNETLILKRKEVLDYIHANYNNYNNDPNYLKRFNNSFWKQMLYDIDNNIYTIENAKRGERLTDEI